ncbi:MAG TPA: DedA family protein [Bacteroidia bacterium]|nr:DedA family protein [Bacteroidia bacterium]
MIETLKHWLDLLLHADTSLQMLVTNYQGWTYLILFIIIFCETGLVITPFLPGDSLLFAAGVIASSLNVLNIYTLIVLIFIAAFSGDNSNYFIGNFIGPKIFKLKLRFIRKDYLERTHAFYEKHGGKTIIIARFIPIIRTFAPFVAGIGSMTYRRFVTFSILGNLLWINSFLWAGYLLGNNEFVKKHFTQVTFGIIIVSLLPPIYGAIRSRAKR